jgi:Outer membrane protein beta-barrel domain
MTKRKMVAVGLAATGVFAGTPVLAQPGATANTPLPPLTNPPPADRPLIPPRIQPLLSFDGGAGVLGYISGTAALGPAWMVRVTGSLSDHVAIEGNYTGSVNRRSDLTGSLVYTGVDAGVRYNILRADQAPLQPYVVGGLGYVGYFGPGGDGAALAIPLAVGAERLLTDQIKVGARFNLRPALFENLAHEGQKADAPATGGSTWTLLANVGGAF